jgi:hypothetical protein
MYRNALRLHPLVFACLIGLTGFPEPSGPNIVFFLTDDLGQADVGCNGSTFYETPNVNQLAADGMRFTAAKLALQVAQSIRAVLPERNQGFSNSPKESPCADYTSS